MRGIPLMFCVACLAIAACAQTKDADRPKITIAKIDGDVPANDAHIVEYRVEGPPPGYSYETGNLRITYSDKSEVVAKLPPRGKSAPENVVYNQVGITEPKLGADRRTIAWTEQFENCCTSYSIPLVVAIYRSGRKIVEIRQGQMVWNWMFVDSGKRLAVVWGPVHLSDIGDYQLYDADTGRMIEEVIGDKEIAGKNGTYHGLGTDAPAWAKELEKLQNGG
jgi:hypothetical protein